MNLVLRREESSSTCTHGKLFVEDQFDCFTLEDVVRLEGEKISGQTAIPAGRYRVVLTFSNRFQRILPLLLDVPNYTGIRIHAGNSSGDTEGCILVGQERGPTTVMRSRAALNVLQFKIEEAIVVKGEEVWIEIKNG